MRHTPTGTPHSPPEPFLEAGACPPCDPEEVSWEYLSRRELPRVTVYLRGLGATHQEAKDCAQTALAESWRKRETVHNFPSYLRKAAQSIFYRSQAKPDEPLEHAEQVASPYDHSPSARAEERATRETILAALRELPHTQRAAMALSLDGYKPTEIAQELGSSPAGVRIALTRARSALKSRLAHLRKDTIQ